MIYIYVNMAFVLIGWLLWTKGQGPKRSHATPSQQLGQKNVRVLVLISKKETIQEFVAA